jgi:hypothetical protein
MRSFCTSLLCIPWRWQRFVETYVGVYNTRCICFLRCSFLGVNKVCDNMYGLYNIKFDFGSRLSCTISLSQDFFLIHYQNDPFLRLLQVAWGISFVALQALHCTFIRLLFSDLCSPFLLLVWKISWPCSNPRAVPQSFSLACTNEELSCLTRCMFCCMPACKRSATNNRCLPWTVLR